MRPTLHYLASLAFMSLLCSTSARAQWAVFDSAAVGQLVTQVQTLRQELETACQHLAQAQAEYRALTGSRGMERLLAGMPRNYLPADWAGVLATTSASGAGGALAVAYRRALPGTAALPDSWLAGLAPAARAQVRMDRRNAALDVALAGEALRVTSARFAQLQGLIAAIPAARDAKSVLDLQARIASEQGMLTNEHTKLMLLSQALAAERRVAVQHERESAVLAQGAFADRFRPRP